MKRALLMFALVIFSVQAHAQRGDIFGGYSYLNADIGSGFKRQSMNGWALAVAGNIGSIFGIEAQVSGEYGTPSLSTVVSGRAVTAKVDLKSYAFMAGPRFSVPFGAGKFFTHVLIGGIHSKASNPRAASGGIGVSLTDFADSSTDFGFQAGGGMDFKINHALSIRAFEADYVSDRADGDTLNHFRIATGILFTF